MRSLLFSVLFILATATMACIPKELFAEGPTIGVSLPLSGGSAAEGLDLQKMLLFANKHIGSGRYSFIFEDDQCSDKTAVSIAHKLTEIDRVDYVLGFACSGAVLASAPIYEKAKVPVIALATGVPEISDAGDYIFRTIPSLNVAAKRLYQHASTHYKSIGILSEETAYCQGLKKSYTELNKNQSLNITTEDYLPGTNDFRTLLTKLRQKKVEAIFLNPQSETGMIQLYQQLRDLQWDIPVYAAYYPGFKGFRERFAHDSEKIVFADLPFVADSLSSQGKKLYQSYQEEYGPPQSSEFYFITTSAAFFALDRAVQSGADAHSYLYNNTFDGFFGSFTFDSNGDVQGDKLTFVLKTLKDGEPTALKRNN